MFRFRYSFICQGISKGVGEKWKKRSKIISKKYRKIALFASSREGATEKRPKNSKKKAE